LNKVTKNGTIVSEYGYDPTGLRVVKKAGGATTQYVFKGTEPIFVKNIATGAIKSYVYAFGQHLARVDGKIGDPNAKKYFYHTDQLGFIKAVTDQTGQVVRKTDYFAFGTQFDQEGGFDEDHGFTGKEYDSAIGLYYYNARWYDPELGRFISADPALDPNNPNLYSYCGNSPTGRIDPDGEFWHWVAAAVVSWAYHAAQHAADVYNHGGDFWKGFEEGLFKNPSISVSGYYGSDGKFHCGERPETTGSILTLVDKGTVPLS
jgi:RHS repeat-associated protein